MLIEKLTEKLFIYLLLAYVRYLHFVSVLFYEKQQCISPAIVNVLHSKQK